MTAQPLLRTVRRSAGAVELELFVPASLDFFADHFPRLGILPGVVQLEWAIRLAHDHLAVEGEFRGLRAIKFQRPILGDTTLTLALSWGNGELGFEYRDARHRYASGRALFARA